MRRVTHPMILILLAAIACACASESSTAKEVETKSVVMQSAGQDVLKLNVDTRVKVTPKTDSINLRLGDDSMDIWVVPSAQNVDDAVGKTPGVIKDEFKEFKATDSTTIFIAGAPAKRLTGTGEEADDGDSGTADVVVFKVGQHVFVACTHGESLTAGAQKWMMAVVETAVAP